MAKVAFSKLGLKKVKEETKIVKFNDIDIEVKQYLPVNDKLTFVAEVISNAADGNRFYNPIKIEAFMALEFLFMYTNLTFTETQKKDLSKLFDIVISNDLMKDIIAAIPADEVGDIRGLVYASANGIYNQMNSAYGLVQGIYDEYKNTDIEATEIQQKIADPNNLKLLRDVLTKLD